MDGTKPFFLWDGYFEIECIFLLFLDGVEILIGKRFNSSIQPNFRIISLKYLVIEEELF